MQIALLLPTLTDVSEGPGRHQGTLNHSNQTKFLDKGPSDTLYTVSVVETKVASKLGEALPLLLEVTSDTTSNIWSPVLAAAGCHSIIAQRSASSAGKVSERHLIGGLYREYLSNRSAQRLTSPCCAI